MCKDTLDIENYGSLYDPISKIKEPISKANWEYCVLHCWSFCSLCASAWVIWMMIIWPSGLGLSVCIWVIASVNHLLTHPHFLSLANPQYDGKGEWGWTAGHNGQYGNGWLKYTQTSFSSSTQSRLSEPFHLPGLHNLRSFLAANLNQNYFLIACVKIFVTFGTKVPYLTFCNKMWRILM